MRTPQLESLVAVVVIAHEVKLETGAAAAGVGDELDADCVPTPLKFACFFA